MTDLTTPRPVVRVIGIAGSLRRASLNRGLLRAAVDAAPEGMEITPFEGLARIPLYNADVEAEGDPEPVGELKEAIRRADALLVATPEYNFGVPGVLKNAIDWASRPARNSVLNGKPAAIMGAAPGRFGTVRAQDAIRQSFLFTETLVMMTPQLLVSGAGELFDADANLIDERTRARLTRFLEGLLEWTRRLR